MAKDQELAEKIYFHGGFNCAQSVIELLRETDDEIPAEFTKALEGFGGGLRRGSACGALVGAVMYLGLKTGRENMEDNFDTNWEIQDWLENEFAKTEGGLTCMELAKDYVPRSDEMYNHCRKCVVRTAQLAREAMKKATK